MTLYDCRGDQKTRCSGGKPRCCRQFDPATSLNRTGQDNLLLTAGLAF